MATVLIFGAGYSGAAIAQAARAAGHDPLLVSRTPRDPGTLPLAEAGPAIARATHILSSAPPSAETGQDPILTLWSTALRNAPAQWFGYLSATGVYGDRAGGTVDEDTPIAPGSDRSRRRAAAEAAWAGVAAGRPLDLFRLAGIYGPGRSVLDDLRAGRARRVIRPGHAFGRIHRDDIARAVLAAIAHPPSGTRILNLSDDEPAESAVVVEEAARLLGIAAPPGTPFEDAWAAMSPMARSFWAENRRVANAKTKAALHLQWAYPNYREGLKAVIAEESAGPPDVSYKDANGVSS